MSDYSGLSDREVDALVAEHLDGWEKRHYYTLEEKPVNLLYRIRDGHSPASAFGYHGGWVPSEFPPHMLYVPRYTASFDEALRVLRAQNTIFHANVCEFLERECSHTAWGGLEELVFECETPRRLCEAMLEARGVTL